MSLFQKLKYDISVQTRKMLEVPVYYHDQRSCFGYSEEFGRRNIKRDILGKTAREVKKIVYGMKKDKYHRLKI